MSSAALVSLEEYLHRSEKPLCEYMDGLLQTGDSEPVSYRTGFTLRGDLVSRGSLGSYARQMRALSCLGRPLLFDHRSAKANRLALSAGGEPERVERGGVLKAGALSVRLEDQ
jgi:hypothetical protein